jgi:CRP-like cAMP-binding protein
MAGSPIPAAPHSPLQNDLLAALSAVSPQAFAPLAAALEAVPMRLGEMLYEPGVRLRHAYFPTTSVVSLHYVTASGASAETAGVGHEGVVGVSLFMGGDTTPSSAVVQTAGHGYRLERSLLLRYTQALMTQICQSAVCYRHHAVEQQLSSWLLSTLDRLCNHDLVMTQELVASLLGVRRESITQAAGRLQQMGYIRYRRGHISVLDAAGLRRSACECYAVVKMEMQRLRADVSGSAGSAALP